MRKNSIWRVPSLTKLEKYLQNNPASEPILLIDGRIPSWSVLDKLQEMLFSIPLESSLVLSQQQLRTLISNVAGNNYKTHNKYIICIRTFMISKNPGVNVGYYGNYDLNGLQDIIIQHKKIQKEKFKQNWKEKEEKARKRIWCGKCRQHKKISDGTCNCKGDPNNAI